MKKKGLVKTRARDLGRLQELPSSYLRRYLAAFVSSGGGLGPPHKSFFSLFFWPLLISILLFCDSSFRVSTSIGKKTKMRKLKSLKRHKGNTAIYRLRCGVLFPPVFCPFKSDCLTGGFHMNRLPVKLACTAYCCNSTGCRP